MTELVIAALSGAGVTITVAIVVAMLGLQLSAAKERLADSRVAEEKHKGQLSIANAEAVQLRARAELAEKRLRDADALVAEMVRDLPVDGAFERLLRAYSRARSLDGAGGAPGSVSSGASASSPGSDDLLKPGE